MNLEFLEWMGPAALRNYIECFLRHYRVKDAFWFIYLTERFGQQVEDEINEKVWGRAFGDAAG